jgi:hypothetical protein
MRRLGAAGILIALSASAAAADPFVGTYRLDVAKSSLTGVVPYAEQTLVISEDGGDLVITSSGKRTDGSAFAGKVWLPMEGGTARRVDGNQQYPVGTVKRTGPNSIEIAIEGARGDGRTTYTLSADGKVLTWTIEGTNAQGQQVNGLSVYDRQ